ncbi:MAG: gamma-glutamylcyclotransferase, partial [Candidatus Eremiobacteraeota bacterium]|nr:gamma-glutamylcyclotransferase [Candidatus Eremiobacteraeota bacterium]
MCGSLLEGARRHDLFGSELPTFDAKLRNWSRARGSDGRYFAMPSPGDAVEGVVVPVDPAQIEKADRAQSLANLHRAIAIVDVDDVRTWAFV